MVQTNLKTTAIGLEQMNVFVYIFIFVGLKILWSETAEQMHGTLAEEPLVNGYFEFSNHYEAFFAVVVFAPLIETYLNQYLFFKYLSRHLSVWAIVLVSGLFFGLMHFYSIGYILYAIPAGVLLSTSYALRLRSNPFVCTCLIHSVYNLIGFLSDRI
jgi:membrane protease YdiL (CAAX protease family)